MQLVADKLAVDRGERSIFSGLSFSVPAGAALVVTGPNGAGKSTLVKAIAGFLPAASGTVRLEELAGEAAERPLAEHCHYLAHDNALKAQLTVAENLGFWQRFLGPSAGMDIAAALEAVGLPGIGELPAGYLSAGQKRRVAIARLLVTQRPVWLVDEPTAALDKASEARFAELASAHVDAGGILVAATHQTLGLADHQSLDMTRFASVPANGAVPA
ncbi:MAG: heme ABC exporter ATP-binding protein CcmA [Pseudomonadota bacterium]|nr:heme ABC exporter ATP-binding protein CcmA [Pseudomonadota bacterium]